MSWLRWVHVFFFVRFEHASDLFSPSQPHQAKSKAGQKTTNLPTQALQRNGSIEAIRTAVHQGRPKCTDIVPGSPLRHFIYKSRGNVQFTMPGYAPYFQSNLQRRKYVSPFLSLFLSILHHNNIQHKLTSKLDSLTSTPNSTQTSTTNRRHSRSTTKQTQPTWPWRGAPRCLSCMLWRRGRRVGLRWRRARIRLFSG